MLISSSLPLIIHSLFSNLETVSFKISVIVQSSFQFQLLLPPPNPKSKFELLFSGVDVGVFSSVVVVSKEILKLLSS
ncbi:MAG: hypothetical protein LBD88_03980 [Candidatus Peribacteria bacterium]|nr:hypothetical protein [Candidatus Peribacteria bacterium]